MSRWFTAGVGLVALATCVLAVHLGSSDPAPTDADAFVEAAPGEILVAFEPTLDRAARQRLLVEVGAVEVVHSRYTDAAVMRLEPERVSHTIVTLSQRAGIREARPNRLVRGALACGGDGGCGSAGRPLVGGTWRQGFQPPKTPLYELQWSHHHQYTWLAWEHSAHHGGSVKIAVLDTGVSPVPTLANVAMDEGANLVEPGASPLDDHGHGTHMASIIASSGSLWGVAPGATIVPIKVLDADMVGTEAALIDGLAHAARVSDLDVVSLSLTFPPAYRPSILLTEAIDNLAAAGVVMVGAAGNDGVDTVGYPARFPQVIAVGAARLDRGAGGELVPVVAEYSNRGYALDLIAFGGDLDRDVDGDGVADGILGESFPTDKTPSGLFVTAGTSPAAAYVAGAVGLLLDEGVPAQEVRHRLQTTAARMGPTDFHADWGQGLLHLGAAMPGMTSWYDPAPATTRYFANAQLVFEQVGGEIEAVAVIEVTDADGTAIPEHEVMVQFGGDVVAGASGYTDADGVVVLRSPVLPVDAEGMVSLTVESVMAWGSWHPVRPIPASRVDRLSFELLAGLGTGLGSAVAWRYADGVWDGSTYVASSRLVETYVIRTLGQGGGGAVVVAMRPDYYYAHDVDRQAMLFQTHGTGMASSSIILDQEFFNPARRASWGAESFFVRHLGPGMGGLEALAKDGAVLRSGDIFVGARPALLVMSRAASVSCSVVVWGRDILNPDLTNGSSIAGWKDRPTGEPGTAAAAFVVDWGQQGVTELGGSWDELEARFAGEVATSEAMLVDGYLPFSFEPDDSGGMIGYATEPAPIVSFPLDCDGLTGAGYANECGGCGPVPAGGCDSPAPPGTTPPPQIDSDEALDSGCSGGGGTSATLALFAFLLLLVTRRRRASA